MVPMETRDVSGFSNAVPRAFCSACSSSARWRASTACICLAALYSKFSLRSHMKRASEISLILSGSFLNELFVFSFALFQTAPGNTRPLFLRLRTGNHALETGKNFTIRASTSAWSIRRTMGSTGVAASRRAQVRHRRFQHVLE